MTAEQCDFNVVAELTVAALPLQIYSIAMALNIKTENVRVDNFNYLCDAPAIAPNAYVTTTTTCNDPNLNVAVTGTLTATLAGSLALSGTVGLSQSGSWAFALTGIPDTQQEIQAIADALTAGLAVSICPALAPCYQVLSGAVDTGGNTTVTIGGMNATFPDTLHLCGPEVLPDDCTPIAAAASANVNIDSLLLIVILVAIGSWLWGSTRLFPIRLLGVVVVFFAGFRALALSGDLYGGSMLGLVIMLLGALYLFHMAVMGVRDALSANRSRKAAKAERRERDSQDYET